MIRKRIFIAPDKFRGTLSAKEAAEAIAHGLRGAGIEALELCPVADGGEGTLDLLVQSEGADLAECEVHDPLGRPIVASWGAIGKKTACVEVARASGLGLLKRSELDPWSASSHGTGELIRAAVETGARKVVVAAGGSATTDGGRGALEALGAGFGRNSVELHELRKLLRGVQLTVACDVQNPLLGPHGSASAYGPQKGADDATVTRLERRLTRLARLAARTTGRDPSQMPMAGAAGGLAGGLWALAGAELVPGADFVLNALDFNRRMNGARAVITGEGTLDAQTLAGKAVGAVATRARQAGIACHAIVGRNRLTLFERRVLALEEIVEAPARSNAAARKAVTQAAHQLATADIAEPRARSRDDC